MDDKLHLVGVGEIDGFGTITEIEQPVKIIFSGLTLDLKVPKTMVNNAMGVRMFAEGDKVRIDCLVEEQNVARTYDRSAFVQSGFKIKRVLVFEKFGTNASKG